MGTKRYTDAQRAEFIALLIAEGYTGDENTAKGALKKVAEATGMHPRTLRRWFKEEQNPAPDDLVRQKKTALADLWEALAYSALENIGVDDIKKLDAKGRATIAAIATDKAQLLKGDPTENANVKIEVVRRETAKNYSPPDGQPDDND